MAEAGWRSGLICALSSTTLNPDRIDWGATVTDPGTEQRLRKLEDHVARLETILDVLLQEIANGTAAESAYAIRQELPTLDD